MQIDLLQNKARSQCVRRLSSELHANSIAWSASELQSAHPEHTTSNSMQRHCGSVWNRAGEVPGARSWHLLRSGFCWASDRSSDHSPPSSPVSTQSLGSQKRRTKMKLQRTEVKRERMQ